MSKQTVMLLVFVGLFVLFWGYDVIVFSAKPDRVIELDSELAAAREELIAAQILAENLRLVDDLIAANLALSDSDSLAKGASVPFLEYLTGVLDEEGVALLSLTPREVERKPNYVRSPYDLKVRCSYRQFGALVDRLEKSERLITIDEFIVHNSVDRAGQKREGVPLSHHEIDLVIATLTLVKQ
jgi:hypothetical protein